MKRIVVALGLLACGKTADPLLEPAKNAEVVDLSQDGLDVHLTRYGKRYTYHAEFHDGSPTDPTSEGDIDGEIVRAFLVAVSKSHRTNEPAAAKPSPDAMPIHVVIPVRGAPAIELDADGEPLRWRTRGVAIAREPDAPLDQTYESIATALELHTLHRKLRTRY